MKVSYSTKPPLYEMYKLPRSIIKVALRENITSHERTSDSGEIITEWTADEYLIDAFMRAELEEDITAHFAEYLARAKADEAKATAAIERAELECEVNKNIAGTLLELDYKLMMIEEFGGII